MPSSAPPANLLARCAAVAADIKLAHTLFALPFALLATFLAATEAGNGRLPSAAELALVLFCMVAGRTLAMAMNRWADAELDAQNPRTSGRAVPAGRVSARFMLGAAVASGFGLLGGAAAFWPLAGNPWPLAASPLVLAWLTLYSFTKRFTWSCHLVLGVALALSPLAAGLALEPAWLAAPAPWLLAGMVSSWVAGFDILYALQDIDFDRERGLFSLPAHFGLRPALWASRLLHVLAWAALLTLALTSPALGPAFTLATGVVGGLLLLEHGLVAGGRTHRLHVAFFTVNGLISLLLGAVGVWEIAAGG